MSRSLLPALTALTALLLVTACGGPAGPSAQATPEGSPDLPSSAGSTASGPAGQPPADGPRPDTRSGAVELKRTGGCTEEYAAAAVGARGFAFDGTVRAIDGSAVTFEVHEWFVGADEDGEGTVTVRLGAPVLTGMSESAPSYSVGTRLLVSGDGDSAWGCGFTRYFDERTAAAWRS